MPNKWQLHWSHLDMDWRCAAQYERRYILGEIMPPGIALIIGSGTHTSVDANMSNKLETGELLPLEAVEDTARDYVAHEFKRGAYWLSPNERKEGRPATGWQDECVDWAVRLSALHHTELAPEIQPTHVERKWVIEVPGFSCDLAGKIDIQEGLRRLHDTKTAGKSPAKNAAEVADQLTMYCLPTKVLDGGIPDDLTLDHLVKLKKPKVQVLHTTRTEDDLEMLLARIDVTVRAIEAGVFPPTSRKNWWCSEKFCGFWDSCKYARGRKAFAMKGKADDST